MMPRWSGLVFAASLLGAGACASSGGDDTAEEQAAKSKISLVASPSTVHVTSGGSTSFTLTLNGTKSNETLNPGSTPDGIDEATSLFISGGEPDTVNVSAGNGLATGTAGTQTFSVQIGKTKYSTKVTFVIDGGPPVDGGAPPADGHPVDGGSPPSDGGASGVTVTIVPSTVTVAPGGHGKFEVVEAGGSSANEFVFASINWGNPPDVVSEDTSIFVAINSETDCDYSVDSDAANQTAVQTIDVSVPATDTTKATTIHTSVTFVIKK